MLITKTNPVGLDINIQQLQVKLHRELIAKWALADDTQFECYGRCYRNKTDTGYIAEVYQTGGEYKEVFWNDTLTALSFFGISGSISHDKMSHADVHLVFFANLSKLALKDKAGNVIVHRADEELRQSVLQVIGKSSFDFILDSVELWLENVLRDYPGSRRDDRLKAVDMHPVHCFRVNLKIFFDPNKNC